MAAAFAMAGLGGCDDGEPSGSLTPPVWPSTDVVGRGNAFATANVMAGYADGVLVTHRAGRPIKVEGNPDHPASLGATDPFGQAAILDFYDPDRASAISEQAVPSDWPHLLSALAAERARLTDSHGAGLRILTGTSTSPTMVRQIGALLKRYPEARWHRWEPISRENLRAGASLAFGRVVDIVPKLDAADVILAIDSDLISSAPGHLRFARQFASRRNPTRTQQMSRVYAIEPIPTLIGIAADHRVPAGPHLIHSSITTLADAILRNAPQPADAPAWLRAAIDDLRGAKGRAFVHAGPDQPVETHALLHAVNESLGGRHATYDLIEPVDATPTEDSASLASLVADMHAGHVSTLIIIDSNPAFTAPGSLGFSDAVRHVPMSLSLMLSPNETSAVTRWTLPHVHHFETWSDARAFDGTATILQPQTKPLYGGVSPYRLLALLMGSDATAARDVVQQTWRDHLSADFDGQWHDALASGVVPDSASKQTDVTLRADAANIRPAPPPDQAPTLLFRPDPHLWDGRFANNAWLQELPRPLTKLVWDNPLLVSVNQAQDLGIANGDTVGLTISDRTLHVPAWILPGLAADCAIAPLGFGRRVCGTVGQGVGIDFYPLTGPARAAPVIKRAAGHTQLASTEHHDLIVTDDNTLARHGTLAAFTANQHFLADQQPAASLYRREPPGPAVWGMSIDLNACIGCNSCVVACMAENNIPVVGKQQVMLGREMHWLRIDRHYEGPPENPHTQFQPIMCMHCEQAPCEVVCPVGATVHDAEGLNVMVYNRCVGTRFCSNNCPYKVRRFNFLSFAADEYRPAVARSPDVTVRARGVMEKCTFCLQRIENARIDADKDDRPVGGNEVRTACQAACPAQAISFGNMAASDSDVAERKQSPLTYALLPEQNTRPRVTYEARISNLNPAVDEANS